MQLKSGQANLLTSTTKEREMMVAPEITESEILSSLALVFVAALYVPVIFHENVDSLVFGV